MRVHGCINPLLNLGGNTLTVTKAGNGSGTVTSNVGGINCGAACGASYANGTVVALTATAAAGSTFVGWSGAGCAGTGTCVVTMNSAATFSGGGGGGAVQARVDSTRIRKTGPRFARRQLKVVVTANEDLRRITLRIRRNGTRPSSTSTSAMASPEAQPSSRSSSPTSPARRRPRRAGFASRGSR